MFKKRIEKVLIFLQQVLTKETAEARAMLKVYYNYMQGEASDEQIESANEYLNKILKEFSFGLLTIIPFSPITIPLIAKFADKHGIDILPEWFKESLKKD